MRCEPGIRKWLCWAVLPQRHSWRPPFYVRIWNGGMQAVHYRSFMTGVSTPGHGEHHRWWLRLEAPLSGGICWWCGLRCYPGPLLSYNQRPRWLFNGVRKTLWRLGCRP
jgi:hypothetical protein